MAGIIGNGREGLSSRMLSRKGVAVTIVSIAIVLCLALIFSMGRFRPKKLGEDKGKASPGFVITQLPKDYADMPPPRVTPERRTETGSEFEKLRAKLLAEKLKRKEEAKRSKLTFQGILLEKSQGTDEHAISEGMSSADRSSRDDFNRQDDKLSFLERKRFQDTRLVSRLRAAASNSELMAGTVIPGLLLTGINSDLPGELLGQVSQNIYDTVTGNELLIPQGTKILGKYDSRIVYGQERVLVIWTRLVFPNGNSIQLEGMPGIDLSGYAGLSDIVDHHYLKLLTGVVFSSVLGATAQVANGRTFTSLDPTFGELALQGVARETNEVGQMITQRNLQIQPTLVIRPGEKFRIFVNKDITLTPYANDA